MSNCVCLTQNGQDFESLQLKSMWNCIKFVSGFAVAENHWQIESRSKEINKNKVYYIKFKLRVILFGSRLPRYSLLWDFILIGLWK